MALFQLNSGEVEVVIPLPLPRILIFRRSKNTRRLLLPAQRSIFQSKPRIGGNRDFSRIRLEKRQFKKKAPNAIRLKIAFHTFAPRPRLHRACCQWPPIGVCVLPQSKHRPFGNFSSFVVP